MCMTVIVFIFLKIMTDSLLTDDNAACSDWLALKLDDDEPYKLETFMVDFLCFFPTLVLV